MNHKGNYGISFLITTFTLILVIAVLAAKQGGIDDSTVDTTIDSLNWSHYNQNVSSSISHAQEGQKEFVVVILEISKKAIDFMGYSIFAIGKLAMQIAKDNPNIINFRVLLWILILWIFIPIFYYIFLAGIVIFLLIREWVLNRRERKRLEDIVNRRKT